MELLFLKAISIGISMSDLEKYEKIIQNIFKEFKCKKFEGNNFSNAIISSSDFTDFRKSFLSKLNNIESLVKSDDDQLNKKWEKTIFDILNSIVDKKNYEGTWSELCALDVLHKVSSSSFSKLDSEIDKNASETLGQYFNKTVTNYDLSLGDNLLIDVKVLADKEQRIIQDLCDNETNGSDITILPEISYQLEYGTVTANIKEIKSEIKVAIESGQSNYRSNVIDDLSYKIQRGNGVLMAIRTHHPYQYAENEHKLVFQHFNKLHLNTPTMLVYVLHPWYSNSTLATGFKTSKELVFRSMARRLFIQYKDKQIDNVLPNNATENLTALMFIIDNSVNNEPYEIFFYTNPNAKNKMYSLCKDIIKDTFQCTYDDFEYDNY